MSAYLDYQVGGEAGYTGGDAWGVMPGDARDTVQMQPFSPAQGMPWWQAMATYGITRAIDNRFAPPTMSGNVQNGSFAGQDGRTYANVPNNQGGRVAPPQAAGSDMVPMLTLAAAGVAAFLLLG